MKNRQIVIGLEKNPPSPDDVLRERMSTEQKIEVAKDLVSHAATIAFAWKVLDIVGQIAIKKA